MISVQEEDPTEPASELTTEPTVTMLPRQPDEQQEVEISTYKTESTMTTEAVPEENEEFSTDTPIEYQPTYPDAEVITPVYNEPETEEPDYEEPGQFEPGYPESETVTPTYAGPEAFEPTYPHQPDPRYPDQTVTRHPISEALQPTYTVPQPSEPRYPPVDPRYPNPESIQPRYTNPESVQPVPPHSQPQHPQIVIVDEDLDVNGKLFKLKTYVLEYRIVLTSVNYCSPYVFFSWANLIRTES